MVVPHLLTIDMEFKEGSSEVLKFFPFALQIYLGTGMLRQSLDARPEVMAEILNQVEASLCRLPHPGPAGDGSA